MTSNQRFFAVVPAAGTGSRVAAALPKQYLRIADRTLLEWSVAALLATDWIERVLVVSAPGDEHCAQLVERIGTRDAANRSDSGVGGSGARDSRARRVVAVAAGGATRRDSVLGGLDALAGFAHADDFVLVHDAARPALSRPALERLFEHLRDDPVGGLLAVPVADTVKRACSSDATVETTVPREGLWLAQTPQMFRFGLLRTALQRHPAVTDEAGAIEAEGAVPRLVEGERRNFKVTTGEDFALMARLLG